VRLALGADHAGYDFRETILQRLRADGYDVEDHGTHSEESCDYPRFAHDVAREVALDPDCRGILICGSGEGMTMVANRYTGVRAALCLSAPMAQKTRAHNDANCLVLAQRMMEKDEALAAVDAFLEGTFDGGRHARRIGQIDRPPLRVSEHPLVQTSLTRLRESTTGRAAFRRELSRLSSLLLVEATRSLSVESCVVDTGLAETEGKRRGRDVLLVPILRAGLGMMDAAERLFPAAPVAHVGMARDEETLRAEEYLREVPRDLEDPLVLLLDPMVATGGTAAAVMDSLREVLSFEDARLVSAVAAPEGVRHVHERHPDLAIYLASLDEQLNEDGLIVPGLGDAGDRLFGTE